LWLCQYRRDTEAQARLRLARRRLYRRSTVKTATTAHTAKGGGGSPPVSCGQTLARSKEFQIVAYGHGNTCVCSRGYKPMRHYPYFKIGVLVSERMRFSSMGGKHPTLAGMQPQLAVQAARLPYTPACSCRSPLST
jgi:hypothetical protein